MGLLWISVLDWESSCITLLLGAHLQRLWPIQGSREREGAFCCYLILLALGVANTKLTEKGGFVVTRYLKYSTVLITVPCVSSVVF